VVEEMDAKADALEQHNSYLRSVLENLDLEKQLLARWRPIKAPRHNRRNKADAFSKEAFLQGEEGDSVMLCSPRNCALYWISGPQIVQQSSGSSPMYQECIRCDC
jgi:hypothetical protein